MRVLTSITLLSSIASAAYVIKDDYAPSNFANMFDFFTGADPTSGYVNYIDQGTAQNLGLLKVENSSVYIGVDNTNVASGRGRDSIRITSKNTYNHGLIILDLAHMPGGQCGSWPAFWMLGPNWPNSGEVDIIEGINSNTENSMTLHTNAGCAITNKGQFSGTLKTSDCNTYDPNQATNAGCSIQSTNTQSYGTGFNSAGGGVYATEWTSEYISIWYFPRSAIPADISNGIPNPENWGLPMSSFSGACDLDDHIFNQQIVFDITFCGQWAGDDFSSDPVCGSKASTCQAYVQNNPTAFKDTYWQINSLKVFSQNGAAQPSSSAQSTSTSYVSSATTQTTFKTYTTTSVTATTPFTYTSYSSATQTSYTAPWTTATWATTAPSAWTTYITSAPSPSTPWQASWTNWAGSQSAGWGDGNHNNGGWGQGGQGGGWNRGGGGGGRRMI